MNFPLRFFILLLVAADCVDGARTAHMVLENHMGRVQNALVSRNFVELRRLIRPGPGAEQIVRQLDNFFGIRIITQSARYTGPSEIEGTVRIMYNQHHPGFLTWALLRKDAPAGAPWKLAELNQLG
ncbi:unnamed protein product [Caenorhabditis sp. 36 PRJEB53466]|nr:unnamed protein product [Caenorhabditis sp. 36 PRJEB53466]